MRPLPSRYPVTAPEVFQDEIDEMARADAQARARAVVLASPVRLVRKAVLPPREGRLAEYLSLRLHPLWGSLVGPAKEAAGGWIEDDDEFMSLVVREFELMRNHPVVTG